MSADPPIGSAAFRGDLHAERRERLIASIADGVAVIPAAPELTRSRDTEVPFRQSTDLYYLTGITEPEALAVLTPHDGEHRFTLFVRPRDPDREAWNGPRLGVEGARERFGADAVYPIGELDSRLPGLLRPAGRIHCPLGGMGRLERLILDAIVLGRRNRQRTGVGPTGLVDLEAALGEMRLLKDDHEIDCIGEAARIAADGHTVAMREARAGVGEWQVQAAMEARFRSRGATGPAFLSIVGGGANATVLHYVANDQHLINDQLLLVDAGAEWRMYCSDITRTFPVSGRFQSHQRDLYLLVLAAEEAGIAAARPGAPVSGIHEAVTRVLVQGMVDLGIVPEKDLDGALESGAWRRFYPHQSSHWLGLDVHDAGPYMRDGEPVTIQPGMVLTVEPGIYIPEDASDVPTWFRGVGIRIEDDVVVRAGGNEILTRDVPVDPDAIEQLMLA